MSPLFAPTAAQKFTPKTLKLSALYHANTGGKKLSGSPFASAQKALKTAGFSDDKIRKVLFNDKEVTVKEMHAIGEALNKARVYGFEKSPTSTIKQYLNKERVKAQSIARIRKEHILEASDENLASYGTTSLNQKGISPNAPKAGEASVLSRLYGRDRHANVTSSLSGKSSSKPTSSFRNVGSAASSLGRPTGSGGVSPKPRY